MKGFEKSKSPRRLVILGNIENCNSYLQTVLRHKSNRILFLGTIYDKDKLNTLRYYARAYLHGHSVGGTNPSLLEAMACSNLIIAHDNPFNREVLGDSGLYWSTPEEVASIVDAVDELRVDAAYRKKMAVEIIRTRYSWERIADAYLSALQDSRRASAVAGPGEGQCDEIAPVSRLTQER